MRTQAEAISVPARDSIILRATDAFTRVIGRIHKYYQQQVNIAMLHSMSDRELKDIGLSRSDLHRIARL
jgi:uncharacterized protein YjiS (DUF1127 family)